MSLIRFCFLLFQGGVVQNTMHTNVNIERNSWRLPPDDTVQVGAGPKEEDEVRIKLVF